MINFDDIYRNFEDVALSGDDEELPTGMAYLSNLEPGEKFYIGDEVYIMLQNTGTGVCRVIRKELLRTNREFGNSGNWMESPIRTYLNNEYYERISDIIGEDNIIQTQRDLTSLDGLDDYGRCADKVSMLTAGEYAKYHKILGVGLNYPRWWWTITPFSTPSNNYSRRVCCVGSCGALDWLGCDCCNGVRPFLSLNSSLLVSLFSD